MAQAQSVEALDIVNEDSTELYISAEDNSSGLAEMQVSLDPAFAGAEWQSYSAITPITFTTNGTQTVYVRFLDNAGNVSNASSDSLMVDTVAPIGAASVMEGW